MGSLVFTPIKVFNSLIQDLFKVFMWNLFNPELCRLNGTCDVNLIVGN